MNKGSGIYKIASPSGKFYIGSTIEFHKRFRKHRERLLRGDHFNINLQRAANKYGLDALTFSIVKECPVDKLLEREQHYLDTLRPSYNISKAAGAPMLGLKHTEAAKAKMSLIHKGSKRSEETRERMRAAIRARGISDEEKARLIERNKQRVWTAEMRAKVGDANRGKVLSSEHATKLKAANDRRAEEAKARRAAS